MSWKADRVLELLGFEEPSREPPPLPTEEERTTSTERQALRRALEAAFPQNSDAGRRWLGEVLGAYGPVMVLSLDAERIRRAMRLLQQRSAERSRA